ncbi:NSS family neurotransmitter:Na+ symporter [Panacagrimonas perspica]|uniref:NSS family neurotransmitter:Na+ symporter n=1 Tax=Panacagrimonas perspica TaxID=381431 RepID=A0A4S3K3I5_9GAMM|nr:sodium-dependent transporter [Panacagrimonas perspica]TDU31199.1 NSS family neurotransmitter:Na+ symporter [Panacagrimonas perspica]THD02556.1 sodium-dependent transporter [Panacagrimonas perspica]
MQIRESSFGYWSSQPAFLSVACGAALGIGSSARVPYLMSEYGGSAFLLVYVLSLLLVGLPILVAEWALGRWMRDELGAGFARLSQASHASRAWRWLGRLAVISAVMILSYYSVIAGWSLGYLFRGAGGFLANRDSSEASRIFLKLARDPERSLAWHTLFMVVVTIVVSYGFRDGIERAAKRMLPAVFVLTLMFALLAFSVGAPGEAVKAILTPDFSRLGWRGVVEAIYQAFFTLGLGLGVMMTLGGYLPASVPLVRMGLWVILADTIFGIAAGTGLLALLLAADMRPTSGLTLIFQSFPEALPNSAAGVCLAVLFYLILFLVTLLAAATLLEPVTRYLMERYRQTRVFAAMGAAVLVWFLGIGTVLSFGVTAELRLFGQNFFEWLQFLTSFVIVPIGGLLVCVYIARVLPRELSLAVWGPRERRLHGAWRFALRYPARLGLVVVLLHGLGLLDWFASLWATT